MSALVRTRQPDRPVMTEAEPAEHRSQEPWPTRRTRRRCIGRARGEQQKRHHRDDTAFHGYSSS